MGRVWERLRVIGPGIAVAATGVGAGDMVAATVSGAKYGLAVIWAVVVGAVLKYYLTDGLARWQLATGKSLLEGWVDHLGGWVRWYFLAYLVFWSLFVGAALISACGLGAHALLPALSGKAWGIIHSLAAATFVLVGRYRSFETVMKAFIAVMFVTLIGCAFVVYPPHTTVIDGLRAAAVPAGSPKFLLGVIGGVGGTLTLLSYGYWIRERQWNTPADMANVRIDLLVAYGLTGVFGFALMVLAAKVLHAQGIEVAGSQGVMQMAAMLEDRLGLFGRYVFVLGFWAAVFTSLLGVWQSVPYLFCEFVFLLTPRARENEARIVNTRSWWYRGYLFYLAIPPIALLWFDRPVAIIVLYSIIGALFMPFLAGTLLLMNTNRGWVGALRYGWRGKLALALALLLFGYLCVEGVREAVARLA